jgi:hypothetical protein
MRYLAPILLLLLGLGALTEPAQAQPNRARQGVQSGEVRSLDQILNGIRRERPGNLADVQGPNAGPYGEPHYRLKWVTPDGRVQWLDTDARTGRVLGVQGDDRPRPGAGPAPGNYGPRDPRFAPRGNFLGPPGPRPEANGPPTSDPRYRGGPIDPRDQRFAPRGNFLGPSGPPPEASGAPPSDPRYRGGPVPVEPRGRFERGPGRYEPPVRGPVGPGPGSGAPPRSGGFFGRNGR